MSSRSRQSQPSPVRSPRRYRLCSHDSAPGATTAAGWSSSSGSPSSSSATCVAGAVGNAFRDEFNLPDVESKPGFDILDEDFGGQGTGIVGTIVFQAEQGVDDPEVRGAMEALFDEVAEHRRRRTLVESPYAEEGEQQISSAGPEAGQIAYANVEMPDDIEFARAERDPRRHPRRGAPTSTASTSSSAGSSSPSSRSPSSEVLGLAFAIVILIVAFGSVLAMGLPVGVALFGIGIGTALDHAAQQRASRSPTSPPSSAS